LEVTNSSIHFIVTVDEKVNEEAEICVTVSDENGENSRNTSFKLTTVEEIIPPTYTVTNLSSDYGFDLREDGKYESNNVAKTSPTYALC
jgi:hypothetical protein